MLTVEEGFQLHPQFQANTSDISTRPKVETRGKGKKVKRMVSIAWNRKEATATYEYGPKVRIQGFHDQLRHSIDGKERIA